MKIKEIEEKENVRVLHAVESGSRAWGFASPDSDYDVRFIYLRNMDDYLSLHDIKDFINWELHKSNATLFEWANSPVVYYSTDEWKGLYENTAKQYFSVKAALYHYYGTANKNYNEYLLDDMVKYKKYFYVLRPILACKWIEQKKSPPPVLFDDLTRSVLERDMEPVVAGLLRKKVKMQETDKAPKIDVLNQYIEKNLEYFKTLASEMQDDRKPGWEPLETKFREVLFYGYNRK